MPDRNANKNTENEVKKNFPETRVMSGFMELLPEDQIEFDRIKAVISETYKSFGFTPVDTPVIERLDVLQAKNVGETENTKLIYEIARGDGKKTEAGLRFDLTVPLARYIAAHFNEITFPFRRAHIAKVYRRERAQKGRFREFYQCDIDVIGHNSLSIRYDAEIPSIIYQLFMRLDFGKFTIRINNRKLLNGFIRSLGCAAAPTDILAVIDRKAKISGDEFNAQLQKLDLSGAMIASLNRFCGISGSNTEVLQQLRGLNIENEDYAAGLSELATVVDFMEALDVSPAYYKIDPVIVRGLDYYTGTVYETVLDDYPQIGSVCSGGRYDDLAGAYIKEKLPGVGISIGLTRLFSQLKEAGVIKGVEKTSANVIILPISDNNIPYALKIARLLRRDGINTDVLLEECSFKKKLAYVVRKDIMLTAFVGDDEEKNNSVKLQYKNYDGDIMKKTVSCDEIIRIMRT